MDPQFIVQPLDLRRNIRANIKSQIVAWADFLADPDRLILHAIFLHAQKILSIAALTRTSGDAVRKRMRKLVARIVSPEFQFIAKNLLLLPPPTQAIARMCILQGRPISEVAAELRLTPNYVRQHRRMAVPMLKMIVLGTAAPTALQMGGA